MKKLSLHHFYSSRKAASKVCLLIIFFFGYNAVFAQNPQIKRAWHWYFSLHAGIDFSSGTAVSDTNGLSNASEGGSTISDTAGNLLFYTNGITVWNHLHQVMPNGTGLMGGTGSSIQAALIVPKPLSPNLYYIFTTDQSENNGAKGMRYTVVDMNLDGGNGDVDTTQKNILLFAPCTEKLAAVNHCDNISVWVMGHEIDNNHFRAYLVMPSGIDTNAIVSVIGTPMTNGDWYGQMKFSPNGKKLATGMNPYISRMELFEFDNHNGTLSNRIIISDNDTTQIGVSFSPDNSKLYIGKTIGNKLFQYDVSIYDSILIVNSKTLIYNAVGTIQGGFRTLQNGPDGRIYINHPQITFDSSLSIINSPNNLGTFCNFSFSSFYLEERIAASGLCDVNESYFNQTPDTSCTSIGCALFCDDSNACTIDTCVALIGCFYIQVNCNDSNACTTDACNPLTGCTYSPAYCNDNNVCTSDTCNLTAGCFYSLINCDDNNICTKDICDSLDACIYSTLNCDDQNVCTLDACDSIIDCTHTPINCNDSDSCTIDACDSITGCFYPPIVNCTDGLPFAQSKLLSIYPNPTSGLVIIEYPGSVIGANVYSVFGQLITSPDEVKNGKYPITFNLSAQPAGVYILAIEIDNSFSFHKIFLNQ